MVSTLASRPSYPRFDSQLPRKFSEEKIADDAKVNRLHCLEESGQRLEIVV